MTNALLVLHAHLPLVRHPEYPRFLEERWFFEALSETYLPLLRVMDGLQRDGIEGGVALSLSPTLLAMLRDPFLAERYRAYLEQQIELGAREVERTAADPVFGPLAHFYFERYSRDLREMAEHHSFDITHALRGHVERGSIELLATAATHAFLPNYRHVAETVRLQVELGIEAVEAAFGVRPRGFWLPECGYYEGLDETLVQSGVEYTVGAAHGVLFGDPTPTGGTFRPIQTPAGLVMLPRDVYSANWIWSADTGYPASAPYRDFYRDIGYDLPIEYIGPYVHDDGIRIDTGFKYHAITGPTNDKRPYSLEEGTQLASEHARDFLRRQIEHGKLIEESLAIQPIITSPFDAELFGHWWFEGPQWIDALYRAAHGLETIRFTTPRVARETMGDVQKVTPTFSSWGSRGYAEVWLDGSNDWTYRHITRAIDRMGELVARFPDESGLKERALNQAAREVLLAMASDWPFILNARTMESYAARRIKDHLLNFNRIYEALSERAMGTEWLTTLEKRNAIFPELDYRRMRLHDTAVIRDLL